MKLRSHNSSGAASASEPDTRAAADPINATLVDAGGLSSEDLDRIAGYRERTGASFAAAVVDLGLVTPETASRALTEHAPSGLIDPDASGISRAVVAAYDPADPLVVKLRALRSSLFNADDLGNRPARILVLTGVGTDDTAGVVANLAVLVAQLSVRGLLVDANFAAPTQHALFGIETDLGATSILVGNSQGDAMVVETPVANLDLLAAGPDVAGLSEMVERVSLIAQIRALRRDYAFAIIDAGEQPPEMVAAIARGADGLVMVVERDQTAIPAMRTLLAQMERNGVPVLGSILAR